MQAGETVAARGVRRALREGRAQDVRGRRLAHRPDASSPSTHIEGVQPPVTAEEFMACEELVQADPGWQAAMRLRGVEDFSLAMIDPWAAGYTGPEDDPSERRIIRPLTWVRSEPGEHGYARPVEGLVVVVDLDAMEVVEVADHGVVALPPKAGQLRPGADGRPGQRAALRGAARRPQADRDHAARGRELHRHRPRRRVAEVARAGRLHAARGARPARALLRRAADHLPRLAGGDVRPLRRPGADAPLQERLRPGRVRRRLAREPAHARLRLRRRDPRTSTASSTTRTASRW